MALWISLHSEAEMSQAVQGFPRIATLEAELEANLSYRLLSSLVLVPDEATLVKLQSQVEGLYRAGLPTSH
jgi:hypothetical protein